MKMCVFDKVQSWSEIFRWIVGQTSQKWLTVAMPLLNTRERLERARERLADGQT